MKIKYIEITPSELVALNFLPLRSVGIDLGSRFYAVPGMRLNPRVAQEDESKVVQTSGEKSWVSNGFIVAGPRTGDAMITFDKKSNEYSNHAFVCLVLRLPHEPAVSHSKDYDPIFFWSNDKGTAMEYIFRLRPDEVVVVETGTHSFVIRNHHGEIVFVADGIGVSFENAPSIQQPQEEVSPPQLPPPPEEIFLPKPSWWRRLWAAVIRFYHTLCRILPQ